MDDFELEFQSERDSGLAELSGMVDSVVYRNEENGYAVFRVLSDGSDEPVTVVGSLPFIGAGESVTVHGTWTTHPSYGPQLKAESVEREMPSGEAAIFMYLAAGNVPGIGPASARRIVEEFGDEAFDILENSPHRLAKLPGISVRRAEMISDHFRRQLGIRRLMEQFISYGIHPSVALRLYKWYGEQAAEFVHKNPYLLANEELGVDFGVADGMARSMGFDEDASERCEAGLLYTLQHNSRNGHVYIPRAKLTDASAQLLRVERALCESAAERLIERGLMEQEESETLPCYLRRLHEEETLAATLVLDMSQSPADMPKDLDGMIERIEREQGIEYAPLQREAIRMAAQSRVFLLTGGPGTGKSTAIRGMLDIFDSMGLHSVLCSPTGRAAKRLAQLTLREAATVHRLLEVDPEYDGAGFAFKRGAENPLDADVVILDETSMVDISLFAALVAATPKDARLVLVGDPDQLPSVGPGAVLSDLLDSERVPKVRLTEIFRQALESNIVTAAHAVNRGELFPLKHKEGDLFFIPRSGGMSIAETVVDLCSRRLPLGMNYDPSQIQVLSPTRRGTAGTASLNNMLQEALNPPDPSKRERRFGDYTFRVGDRVMHIRNNYDLEWQSMSTSEIGYGVFNGDIGVIEEIEARAEYLAVRYDDRRVQYGFDILDQLEPAFAMTVHKSQGSEYPAVVLTAAEASPRLLSRPVLYTAMTRAQSLLVIVGSDEILQTMIANNKKSRRYSGLKRKLMR